jgi:hypothetical protein
LLVALELQGHLIGFGVAALLFDVVGRQEHLPGWTQAVGALALLLVLAIGWRHADGPRRRILAALTVLVLGVYGIVAVGRGQFLAGFGRPLAWAAASPRYHYLRVALLTILVCAALMPLTAAGRLTARLVYGTFGLVLLARAVAGVVHPLAIKHWDAERAETSPC